MTQDIASLDAEIAKLAESLERAYGQHGPWEQAHVEAVINAVRAKREALTPKLLTAEEARAIWHKRSQFDNEDLRAVLTACHDRAYRVIEGLHRYVPCVRIVPGCDGAGGELAISDNALAADERCAVLLHEVRRALGVQS